MFKLKKYLFVIFILVMASWQSSVQARVISASQWQTPLVNESLKTTLSHYKGKVIWLDFWASWCSPCRASFPWLNNMQQRYASKGLKIIAVNVDENTGDAKQFLQQIPAKFQVFFDPDGKAPELFNIQGMPTSVMIDRNGKIRLFHIGFNEDTKDRMEDLLEQTLNQKK